MAYMFFDEEFLELLVELFHDLKLDAVIVGNAASQLHGCPVLMDALAVQKALKEGE
jgi:hypothetical protein